MIASTLAWSKDVSIDDLVERDGLYYEKFTDVPFTGNIVGKIQAKINQGLIDGPWLEYHDNGQLKIRKHYKDGNRDGEYLNYYENGQLRIKQNFKNGT